MSDVLLPLISTMHNYTRKTVIKHGLKESKDS